MSARADLTLTLTLFLTLALGACTTVSVEDLRAKGLAKKRGKIKVLGEGDLDKNLTIEAHAFSGSARKKIEAAGGTCVVVGAVSSEDSAE